MSEKAIARYIKPGEMLAIKESALNYDAERKAFFWLMGPGSKPNERRGDVAIVHIRGELDHHEGYGENYEGITKRFTCALTGQDVCDQHKADWMRKNHIYEGMDDSEYESIDAIPPSAVVVCIDSPGGVVSGLNECVKTLINLKKEHKIPVIVYVNEMAASAAYALSCVGDEIIAPPSAIIGSIGVISTMISQAAKNKKDGYDVRLLTSGMRKADGHVHQPITEDAVEAEMDRVRKLAWSFWKLASRARGISTSKISSFEAGIFLGPDALKRGLIDDVMSFEDVIIGASKEASKEVNTAPAAGGNQTDRKVRTNKPSMKKVSMEADMPVKLSALIKKTEAKIASEKDPKKLASLLMDLSAYKKTEKHVEHTKSEEGDEDDDEDCPDDESESEEEEATADPPMKKSKKSAKPPMDDDEEDDDEDEEEDEESEESEEKAAKAVLALVKQATGMKGSKAVGAAKALFQTAAQASLDVQALKKSQMKRDKESLIEGAIGNYISKQDAKWLRTQKLSIVQGYIAQRKTQGKIIITEEGELLRPKHVNPGTEESLPKETLEMINQACAHPAPGVDPKALREELVKNHLAAHAKHLSNALNGVGRI